MSCCVTTAAATVHPFHCCTSDILCFTSAIFAYSISLIAISDSYSFISLAYIVSQVSPNFVVPVGFVGTGAGAGTGVVGFTLPLVGVGVVVGAAVYFSCISFAYV